MKAKTIIEQVLAESRVLPASLAVMQRLNDSQVQAVADIINRVGATSDNVTKPLKEYLRTQADDLGAKGLLPDYAAYAITASFDGLKAYFASLN